MMKLLFVLNENPLGSHIDIHKALAQLKQEKRIQEYKVFPWMAFREGGFSSGEISEEIFRAAKEFEPTSILWAHTDGFKIHPDEILKLRQLPTIQSMGYYEGDVYESPYKPLPAEVLQLAASCNIVFSVGFGPMTDQLTQKGCRDIRYIPSHTDPWRFGKLRNDPTQIVYDVAMIGNKTSSRLPWRTMPGCKERENLAEFLYKKLGDRFALFGTGWEAPYANGPIPFDKQIEIYHKSRVAVGVNNLHARYYFSNRLSIAMSCGIPVVHGYELGFDEVFPTDGGIYFFKTSDEAWKIIAGLLEKKQTSLDEIGEKAYRYSLDNFSVVNVLSYMCKSLESSPTNIDGRHILVSNPNPWI